MIRYFKTFFYPASKTYSYHQPKEQVIATIKKIFEKKVTLLSDYDTTGRFLNEDTFKMDIVSPANTNGITYSSTLIGRVIEIQSGGTEIKTKAPPSNALYVLFIVTLIVGLICCFRFIQERELKFLFLSLIILVAGWLIVIGISKAATTAIYKRYHLYIDKELKM